MNGAATANRRLRFLGFARNHMALRRSPKTMKMRPSFYRRSGAGRSPGAGARFPTQGRTEGIGPLQFVFIAMTLGRPG